MPPLTTGSGVTGGPPGTSIAPPASSLPSKPPGVADTAELRKRLARVTEALGTLQAKIAARTAEDPEDTQTDEETKLIAQYEKSINDLTTQVTSIEAQKPSALSGGSPADKHIVRQMPDGTLDVQPNPNWDGTTEKPQVVSMGDRIFTVGVDGKVTVAYTDTDAKQLADRQTRVAESNSETARKQQEATDYATRAKVELEERVARGEDAASVRAQQAQDLAALHQEWVRADGDSRRASEELRDYNTTRHQDALQTLERDQLEATKEAQKRQDETLRRSQDLQAIQADRTSQLAGANVRANMANQRMSTGAGYMGNVMQMLTQLNQTAPPGSDAVGAMLPGLLGLGRQFFSDLGGLPSNEEVLGPDPGSSLAALAAANTGNPPAAGANPALPGTAAPGLPPQAAAQQAAARPLAPDGSPYATPADVERLFGRSPTAGATQALGDPYGR
jgi:hypothetical protein